MRLYLSARLLLLAFALLAAMLITSSATAEPPALAVSSAQSLNLPWTMSGCWEYELFHPQSAAPLAVESN